MADFGLFNHEPIEVLKDSTNTVQEKSDPVVISDVPNAISPKKEPQVS